LTGNAQPSGSKPNGDECNTQGTPQCMMHGVGNYQQDSDNQHEGESQLGPVTCDAAPYSIGCPPTDCWDPGLGPGCYGPVDCNKTI